MVIDCHESDFGDVPQLVIQQETRKGVRTPLVVSLNIEDAKVAYKALQAFLMKHEGETP